MGVVVLLIVVVVHSVVVVVVGEEVVVAVVAATQPVVDLPEPSSQTSVTSAGRGVGVTGGLGRSQPLEVPPTPRRVWLTAFSRGLAPFTSSNN